MRGWRLLRASNALQIAKAKGSPRKPCAQQRTLDARGRSTLHGLGSRLDFTAQGYVAASSLGGAPNCARLWAVRAAPDGYTLGVFGAPSAINATLYDKLNFNFVRDIAPVAPIVRFPYIMVVNPSVPAKTLPEFIAYAKANPGKINMASPGSGSTPHVNGELFKVMTGTNMVHVTYRSAAAVITDLLSGQVQLYFGTTASLLEYVRTGKLRALAVTIERRLDALPDVPTVAEFVPGYEASNWYGIGAPRNTPVEVIEKLNKETNAGLADPKLKARLADLGGTPLLGSPADFGKLIAEETEKWGKVVKFSGAKAD
jgi:tripartite-type tricarboxylate transporter receptor subunit TctC